MDKSNPCNCCNRCKAAKALLISVGDRVEAKATSGRWWPARVRGISIPANRGGFAVGGRERTDELEFDLIVDDGCSTEWTRMPWSSIRRRVPGETRKKGSIPREAALLVPGESRAGTGDDEARVFVCIRRLEDVQRDILAVAEEATKNGGKKRKLSSKVVEPNKSKRYSDCTRGNPCGVYYRCPKHTLFGRPKRP